MTSHPSLPVRPSVLSLPPPTPVHPPSFDMSRIPPVSPPSPIARPSAVRYESPSLPLAPPSLAPIPAYLAVGASPRLPAVVVVSDASRTNPTIYPILSSSQAAARYAPPYRRLEAIPPRAAALLCEPARPHTSSASIHAPPPWRARTLEATPLLCHAAQPRRAPCMTSHAAAVPVACPMPSCVQSCPPLPA